MNNKDVCRGDIFTTNLGGGIGSEQQGHKYCVVVQNDIGNSHSTTTVVIPITSHFKNMPTHYRLKGVLPQISYVVCEQIRVVDKRRLINKVTKVSKEDLIGIGEKIKLQLDII